MATGEQEAAAVKSSDLIEAFEFVSASDDDEHLAYICKKTGQIIFVANGLNLEDETEFSDDPDPADYLPVPHRRDLDLGRRAALAFVAEELPGSFDKARDMFSKKGAYGRFKHLLRETGTLEKWYAFEAQAAETALKAWCDEVEVTLTDD